MSRVDNIKRYAERREQAKIDSENLSAKRIEEYKAKIKELEPRIAEILAVGEACRRSGIPLTGSSFGGHEGYDTHQFISNGWSHVTGFISEGPDDKPFTRIGKIGGGACDWNLKTDGNTIFVDGRIEYVLKKFLDEFDEFETKFYEYVDKITE